MIQSVAHWNSQKTFAIALRQAGQEDSQMAKQSIKVNIHSQANNLMRDEKCRAGTNCQPCLSQMYWLIFHYIHNIQINQLAASLPPNRVTPRYIVYCIAEQTLQLCCMLHAFQKQIETLVCLWRTFSNTGTMGIQGQTCHHQRDSSRPVNYKRILSSWKIKPIHNGRGCMTHHEL